MCSFFLSLPSVSVSLFLSLTVALSFLPLGSHCTLFVRLSLSLSLLIVTVGAKRSHVDVYETTQCRLRPLRRPSSNIVAIRWRRTTRRQRSRKEVGADQRRRLRRLQVYAVSALPASAAKLDYCCNTVEKDSGRSRRKTS